MTLLQEETFVCLDCESTGLDPKLDRIVEVAVVVFTFDRVIDAFESLVNPERDIPQVSQDIHKISPEMVVDQPKIGEVLPQVLKLMNGHTIVGHGIGFDVTLVSESAKRCQVPCNIDKSPTIDTLRLARLYGESPTNSLDRLRQHFNIEAQGVHRAMSDVLVNIEVFKHLAKPHKTVRALFQALEKPIRMKTMPLGKHKGRPFAEIPLEYLTWAERKDFDQDLLFSIRSELKERKKGDGFRQSANPFQTL